MIVNKYGNGGGGSASGVTPEQVQQEIQSALTPYWESGITKEYVDSADTIVYASATSRMDDVEEIVSSALNEFHTQILEVSAATNGIELPIAAAVNKLKGDFEARLDQQYYKKQETNNLLKEKVTAGQVDVQIKNYTDPLFQAVHETIEDKELPVSAAINELNEAINLIDEVVPAALVNLNETKVGSESVHTIWRGTQIEYDAITTKDASTLYIIVNE